MKTKFVKHTMQRDKRYQIITLIQKDDHGKLFVLKRAKIPEGIEHIRNIYQNCQRIKAYDDKIKVPGYSLQDDDFISEFIHGETLESKLKEAVQKGSQQDLIRELINYYSFLKSLPATDLNPSEAVSFNIIFSKTDQVFRCLNLGLIDLIPENIIDDNQGNMYHIDCEWLIEAPVPVDFVFYRALVVFYNKHHQKLASILNLQQLLEQFKLTENVALFALWETEFAQRIHGGHYNYKSQYLLNVPTVDNWKDKRPEHIISSLFYGIDSDFTELNKIEKQHSAKNGMYEIEYVFTDNPQMNSFRWDPCENACVGLDNIEAICLTADKKQIGCRPFSTNGISNSDKLYFFTSDPQLIFKLDETVVIDKILIRGELNFYSFNELIKLSETQIKQFELDKKNLQNQFEEQQSILIKQHESEMVRKHKIISNYDYELNTLENKLELSRRSIPNRLFRPARFIKHKLKDLRDPLNTLNRAELTCIDDSINKLSPGVFESNNDDPKVTINRRFKSGLYLFKWDGEASRRAMLKIYPICKGEANEFKSIRLGFLENTYSEKERFIFLRDKSDFLRIDLGETPGNMIVLNNLKYKRIPLLNAVRIGISLISRNTGFSKLGLMRHFVKLVLTGKKHEARSHFVEAFNSFGDGKTVIENDESAYVHYIQNCEPTASELHRQQTQSQEFDYNPLISIVVPVYNTDSKMLTEMIESVRQQTYDNWQLCLADGKSQKKEVIEMLKRYESIDKRINCKYLSENQGIVGNSNEALKMAKGEFTALLDHDDLLSPWALFEIVRTLNDDHEIDMLYSDEDKIAADSSKRYQPHFKPDWSPDLLRSYNYITHLFVARTSLISQVGGFRPGYDGSQDHDLIFRVSERARRIHHIPSILYHWRSHESSTALNPLSKSYTLAAGVKAINDHLQRIGLCGQASFDAEIGIYHINYELKNQPLVSIIIPNYEQKDILERCINSIKTKSSYINYEIIIIENNSKKQDIFDYYKKLELDSHIKVVTWPETFNYSAINNFGVKHATGEFLILLNNDTEIITPDWIEQMLQYAQREDVGCVGAKLYYTNGLIQHAGVVLGFQGIAAHSFCQLPGDYHGYMNRAIVVQNVSAVTAACMMIRKNLFLQVDGLDESLAVAFNDIDFCLKIRSLGKLNIFNPRAELYHHESLSRGYEDTEEKQKRFASEINRFKSKWSAELKKGDPYYSPHLDLELMPFRISGE